MEVLGGGVCVVRVVAAEELAVVDSVVGRVVFAVEASVVEVLGVVVLLVTAVLVVEGFVVCLLDELVASSLTDFKITAFAFEVVVVTSGTGWSWADQLSEGFSNMSEDVDEVENNFVEGHGKVAISHDWLVGRSACEFI